VKKVCLSVSFCLSVCLSVDPISFMVFWRESHSPSFAVYMLPPSDASIFGFEKP
jgi:hypothetical protein